MQKVCIEIFLEFKEIIEQSLNKFNEYGLLECICNLYQLTNLEEAAAADKDKFTTIIPLGVTQNRSIFFNPVQVN